MIALAGCNQTPDGVSPSTHRGRYQGIGTYSAGPLWSQLKVENRRGDAAAANLDDDEQVIVVVDSQTGEVRQCGNLSGHCIGMNPWAGPGQSAPVPLNRHAADLEREEAAQPVETNAASGASPDVREADDALRNAGR